MGKNNKLINSLNEIARRNLKCKLVHRVCLLTGHIDTLQCTHVTLLSVRNRNGFLEDLSYIGKLASSYHFRLWQYIHYIHV